MLKKNITYTNFAGETVTEDFYFNLSKAELLDMKMSAEGGDLAEYIRRIQRANDGKEIMRTFREIILNSYGVRSIDGRQFNKSEEANRTFLGSGAYDVLFTELVTDAGAASSFINALMPPELLAAAQAQQNTVAENTSSQSVSQLARERSEAQFQGHMPKHEAPAVPPQPTQVPAPQETVQPQYYDVNTIQAPQPVPAPEAPRRESYIDYSAATTEQLQSAPIESLPRVTPQSIEEAEQERLRQAGLSGFQQ